MKARRKYHAKTSGQNLVPNSIAALWYGGELVLMNLTLFAILSSWLGVGFFSSLFSRSFSHGDYVSAPRSGVQLGLT